MRRAATVGIRSILFLAVAALLPGAGCRNDAPRGVQPLWQSFARRHVTSGRQAMTRKDYRGAAAAFERALAFDDDNAAAHAALGELRSLQGRDDDAVEHFRRAVKSAPDNFDYALALADSLSRLAVTSVDRNQTLAAAVRAYEHASWLGPNSFEAMLRLGVCQHRLGRLDLAVEALRQAKKTDPDSATVYIELGRVYDALFEHEQALAAYSTAVKLEPENPIAHNGCGAASMTLSQQAGPRKKLARLRALAHFRRSLQIDPNQPQIRSMLGRFQPEDTPAVAAIEDESN